MTEPKVTIHLEGTLFQATNRYAVEDLVTRFFEVVSDGHFGSFWVDRIEARVDGALVAERTMPSVDDKERDEAEERAR